MSRLIFHIDMDAFFASVEQACNPALKGKPIAVTGTGERTVVTTSSYEARRRGVKTGLTVYEARKRCPELILVEGDASKYTFVSARANRIFQRYTPFVEMYSIDESFLDLTDSPLKEGSAAETARAIKRDVYNECGVRCSIGIAPNKLLAKVASDMGKPDGLFYLAESRVPGFLENLPVSRLCGVGRKTADALSKVNISTCGEMGRASVRMLRRIFGIVGERLSMMARGMDASPVVPIGEEEEAKSIGHSSTFEKDVFDRGLLHCYLLKLCDMVSQRMRRDDFWGRTVTLTVRYADFTTFSRQKALGESIQHPQSIFYCARSILEGIPLRQAVRLLGVSVSGLSRGAYQEKIFEDVKKKKDLLKAMDKINHDFGKDYITWGMLVSKPVRISRVISPSWRYEGSRRY